MEEKHYDWYTIVSSIVDQLVEIRKRSIEVGDVVTETAVDECLIYGNKLINYDYFKDLPENYSISSLSNVLDNQKLLKIIEQGIAEIKKDRTEFMRLLSCNMEYFD